MQGDSEVTELLNQNMIIVKRLEEKAKMFGKGMLVLSLLDCLFGILAIFCTSLTLVAFFASATSLTAITICGRIIQISKIRQLEKSLRTVNLISIAWFVNRYKKNLNKRSKKIKMTKSTFIQKILTAIIAIFGVGGIVVAFLPQFAPVAEEITKIVSICMEGLASISGIALATTSDKVLSEEEVKANEQKAAEKQARKEAMAELEEIQANQLEELVQKKLAEKQNETPAIVENKEPTIVEQKTE